MKLIEYEKLIISIGTKLDKDISEVVFCINRGDSYLYFILQGIENKGTLRVSPEGNFIL